MSASGDDPYRREQQLVEELVGKVVELGVYLPVGVALSIAEDLPRVLDKGRARVQREVGTARVVGHFAVSAGSRLAARSITDLLTSLGMPAPPPFQPKPERPTSKSPERARADRGAEPGEPEGRPTEATSAAPEPETRANQASGDASGLAIPGYDALAASQVVQRLPGLTPAELAAVVAYESSTRKRRTILSRASQLQSARKQGGT